MVNPPKEGDGGRQSEGLFVRDGRGNKYLTHSGNLIISGKNKLRNHKNIRDQLMAFTGPGCWIDVTNKDNKRFLVARLGRRDPSNLIDRIDRVARVIESFKSDDSDCPLTLDDGGIATEDSSTGKTSSALNTILYGPPGTGKTYATFRRCVEICDGKEDCLAENGEIRARYKKLGLVSRICG